MAKSSNCKNDRATRSVAVALEPRSISPSKATQVNKNQTQQQWRGGGEKCIGGRERRVVDGSKLLLIY